MDDVALTTADRLGPPDDTRLDPRHERWTVQSWLERAPWRTLKDTQFGRDQSGPEAHPALHEDPLLQKVYLLDIALFLSAERVSYLAVSKMVSFAPDEAAQIQLGTQVLDECRHFEVFSRRLADFGYVGARRDALVDRYLTPGMRSFYALILEQADRRDFLATSVAQNLVLEGMAYPVYRYEIKYWSRFDPELSRTIQGAFADESHHVGFGEAVAREALQRADDAGRARAKKIIHECHQLMTQVFEEVIKHYIGLYQECANAYLDVVGDVEIFPGRKLAEITEEEQARTLLAEIQHEHQRRMQRIGLGTNT